MAPHVAQMTIDIWAGYTPTGSIDIQIKSCRRRYQKVGCKVGKVITDDAISGADDNRPAYLALKEPMRLGNSDGAIANETNTFGRSDTGEIQGFVYEAKFRDQVVLSVKERFDSREPFTILQLGLFNGMDITELHKISERTRHE
jgi:DNA invertase Pin-like site-specific DNA recombinase